MTGRCLTPSRQMLSAVHICAAAPSLGAAVHSSHLPSEGHSPVVLHVAVLEREHLRL